MKIAQSYLSPIFYNKKIQDLNELLNNLGWIQYIQSLAHIGEDDEGTFPEVYFNDGSKSNIRIFPEGNSFSFFMLNGNITQAADDEGFWYNVPLSLYVWADLSKIYPSKEYDYTAELIKDVLNVLEKNGCNDIEIITDNVFSEFSQLEKVNNQNIMLPFTAFRIDFNSNLTKC